MCLILFAYQSHPRYRLVVAANRDEFYRRPASPAAFWPDEPRILAGQDLQEGGTWMGITTTGRFAALTNYRDPARYRSHSPSRGHLVSDYLRGDLSPRAYLDSLEEGGAAYNGFNLLLGTWEELFYYSNREKRIRPVPDGIHGLSNSLLDVPWPKVERGTAALAKAVKEKELQVEQLFTIMVDRQHPHDLHLPDTGVGLETERMLAPAFVTSPDYGTRLTTVILADRDNRVHFWERTYLQGSPDIWKEVCYQF